MTATLGGAALGARARASCDQALPKPAALLLESVQGWSLTRVAQARLGSAESGARARAPPVGRAPLLRVPEPARRASQGSASRQVTWTAGEPDEVVLGRLRNASAVQGLAEQRVRVVLQARQSQRVRALYFARRSASTAARGPATPLGVQGVTICPFVHASR